MFDVPQSISFESATHGTTFTARCLTPFGPPPSGLKAIIALSAPGVPSHIFTGAIQGGGVFRFTAQAITPAGGPHVLSVGIIGDGPGSSSTDMRSSALQVIDGPIMVRTRSLKLSDVSRVDRSDASAPVVVP